MMPLKLSLFFCGLQTTLAFFNLAPYIIEPPRDSLTIYYEAFEFNSYELIALELYTVYKYFLNYIHFIFVPYGRSNHTVVNGEYKFECKNGPEECFANKVHACELAQNNGQETDVEFITCIMLAKQKLSLPIIKKCAEANNLSFEKIKRCASCTEGDKLLAKLGNKTKENSIYFVPGLVISTNSSTHGFFRYSSVLHMLCFFFNYKKNNFICEDENIK